VSDIAASVHAEGTAYVTLDCHHRNDYAPHVLMTTDFGRTWSDLSRGLPADRGSFTIVENTRNARLLFVGTANGVYTSVDGGRRWVRLGRNFPNVMVARMAYAERDRELVIATHGRGLYIASVGPLEEFSDSLLGNTVHLFAVAPALQFRLRNTWPSGGTHDYRAPNPPRGAVIWYWVKEVQPEGVRFLVTTAQGDTLRTLTGSGYPGLQRVVWDLNRDRPRPRGLGDPTNPAELRRLGAGEYVVRTAAGGRRQERTVQVAEWPEDRLGRIR
jgi:hypothetical protein